MEIVLQPSAKSAYAKQIQAEKKMQDDIPLLLESMKSLRPKTAPTLMLQY